MDWFRSKLGLSPIFIKCFGKPDEFALMSSPTCHEGSSILLTIKRRSLRTYVAGFKAMFRQGSTPFSSYPNIVTPRVSLEMLSATYGSRLKDAKCPLLVVLPVEDDLIPADLTRRLTKEANGSMLI